MGLNDRKGMAGGGNLVKIQVVVGSKKKRGAGLRQGRGEKRLA